ncbi:response regulator [Prevotella communis]|uniref:response regulator n=1 Tax=Prevotella communis TaxID=2913614 RepID=UPI001EDA95A3|nr:response regulator [Prevotella communis]UKK55584.1 response regulator [Prevotella communis]
MKILVVDDEQDICEILQYNLENEGFEVVTACSAEEALTLPLQDFSLILLDVMMGEMSGFQMTRLLKANPATAQIPIIFITALDSEDQLEKGLKLTAHGYIPPKTVTELYELGSHSWSTDWYKQKSEPKTEEVQVLRVVLKECGLIKTRIGKLSLTAKGKQLLADHNELMRTMIQFLFRNYNTGWLDLYEDNEVGNLGRLYSLWLLHHYGVDWRGTRFYADEYSRAFPMLNAGHGYEYRVFNRLFRFIGLCEINESDEFKGKNWGKEVRKTELLDMMFAFEKK